jgi:hypothetical protein
LTFVAGLAIAGPAIVIYIVPMIPNPQLIYAAGVLDASATMQVVRAPKSDRTYRIRFRVELKAAVPCRATGEVLQTLFGGRLVPYGRRFRWAVASRGARPTLLHVRPFLIGQRERADAMLDVITALRKRPNEKARWVVSDLLHAARAVRVVQQGSLWTASQWRQFDAAMEELEFVAATDPNALLRESYDRD